MEILVIGGGGREHAIVKKLKESPKITKLYCAPGNGGISRDAECVPIKAVDIEGMTDFAVKNAIDFAVVAPDDPLVLGMADALTSRGVKCFGPSKAAARIEGSKIFSKNLMKKYGIPTAEYATFTDFAEAKAYINQREKYPLVIKADGLALGKGVVIAENKADALAAAKSMMEDAAFGENGKSIVIEQFLTGPEVTVLAFTDGRTLVPMISSMDHKRALDGDKGLNTGGMGTIAPNPHYDEKTAAICMEKIFLPTLKAMQNEGCPFKGCLYFGLMLTPDGPMVIEYNCRFGDPETQVVLPMLESDLLEIMLAVSDERLNQIEIKWKDGAAACVVLASGGYPAKYSTGFPISGLDANGGIAGSSATVYHAGTTASDTGFATAGGRVLGVSAIGADLDEALTSAYSAAGMISFENMSYRRDIGKNRQI